MSVDVRNFLDNSGGSNFTDSVPRPPPQGEENEQHSTGGHSAKSSGSHKSQHSGKSLGSSGKTSSAAAAVSHSPSATPRKSHQSGVAADQQQNGGGGSVDEAPLGFEPEGRSRTPPFSAEDEGTGVGGSTGITPPPLPISRWTESLETLLEDVDGVRLFREYLDQQQSSNLFEFYFAWKYLNQLGSVAEHQKDTKTLKTLIKTMFKVYIKGDKGERKLVTIRTELKEAIVKRMADRDFHPDIYDQVKDEVMDRLKRHFYPEFLRSDLYVQFAAAATADGAGDMDGSKSCGSSGSSSGSSSARGQLAASALLLPTLHEDCELDMKTAVLPSDGGGITMTAAAAGSTAGIAVVASGVLTAAVAPQSLPLTQDAIRLTERLRQDEGRAYVREHDGKAMITTSLPYHATAYASSYLPISAIDSERQSLSSDALTDDTLSVTDSSVDGYPIYSNKKSLKRYHMKLSKIAQRNPDSHPQPAGFQPRTERFTKVSSLAESDPAKFAEILIQRLQAILDDDKRTEMIQSRLNAISESEDADDSTSLASSAHTGGGVGGGSSAGIGMMGVAALPGAGGGHHHATTLNQLLLAMQQQGGGGGAAGHAAGVAMDDDGDGDAQGILDMHCKRIWEKSGQHSPSKSPHSPPPHEAHGGSRRNATLPRSSAAAAGAMPRPTAMPGMPKGAAAASGGRQLHGGVMPAGSYFAAEQPISSGAAAAAATAAAALFQRESDSAAAAVLRQMHGGQSYGLHYMAGAQQPLPSSVHHHQQQLLLQQQQQLQQLQLVGGLRQQQQLLLPPSARLSVQQQQVPQFSAGAAGSAFKPVVLPTPLQQQQAALALQLQQQAQLVSAQSSQCKVIEWISRNEEVTQVSAAVAAAGGQNSDSEKASSSHKRSSHKSGSTTASPRQHRPKSSSHVKKLPPYVAMIPDFSSLGMAAGSSGGAMAAALPSRAAIEEMAKKLDERHLSSQLAAASAAAASAGKPPRAAAAVAPQATGNSRERGSKAASGVQQQQRTPAAAAAAAGAQQQQPAQLRVAYYLNDQPIPYSTTVPMSDITLLKFKELVKELIAKKGAYRYFFKKANEDELGSDVTHFFEEVTHDSTILPKWEGKVIGYVKKVD